MKRALVLGGGGPIGVEWEAGLVRGLSETGFALDDFEAVVGTSAGALVGSYVAHGRVPALFDERRSDGRTEGAAAGALALLDPSQLDARALGAIFQRWSAIQHTTAAEVQAIGALVRGLDRSREQDWVAHAAASTPFDAWPSRRLLVVAVDTESGERRVFARDAGVPFERALAASMAVPGLFPAVEIDGCLYMDGQVWSSTNADLLVAERPEQVLIAMPTNAATGRGIGPHAERMLEREIAALRAVGSDVRIVTPSAADTERMGTNLMDYGRRAEAFAVGLGAGRAFGETLRAPAS
jgi:NTE family protein